MVKKTKAELAKSNQEKIQSISAGLLESFRHPENLSRAMVQVISTNPDLPMAQWSCANKMRCYLTGASDCRGFQQWKKVGHNVKKGEHSLYILAPMVKKIEDKDEEDGEEKKVIYGFKLVPVFDISQTTGETVKTNYQPAKLPKLMDVAKKLNLKVTYTPKSGDFLGWFCQVTKQINLCTASAHVFHHELSHAVHSEFENLNTLKTAYKEIIAEFSACVLDVLTDSTNEYGEGITYNYVASYAGAKTPNQTIAAINKVMDMVYKVVTRIMEVANEIGIDE